MTAIELKKLLIHKIAEINDESFLKALITILESRNADNTITLTQEQKEEIESSQKEVEQGLFYQQNELDKEFDKWLNA